MPKQHEPELEDREDRDLEEQDTGAANGIDKYHSTQPPPDDGKVHEDGPELELGWRNRLRYFTWTWFTMSMATSGIANAIHACPLEFKGIYVIGVIFMIIGIIMFLFNCICISLRFYYWPGALKGSLLHPTESLFVAAPVISVSIILANIIQYGANKTGTWLVLTMAVCYWIYIILAVLTSFGMYLVIWSSTTHTISEMTPIWIFPAYPLLLVGPYAAVLAPFCAGSKGLQILVGGLIVQGIGFLVSLMIYAAYVSRLMTQKLPAESSRPGMFISVGPSGFTITALIRMGDEVAGHIGPDFMGNGQLTGQITKVLANWSGLWLWGLALWFFFVSVGAHYTCVQHGRLRFAMTWYSFIFPNSALTLATFAVAQALDDNRAINIIGAVMLCGLIVTWFFVVGMMIRALFIKQILWPPGGREVDVGAGYQPKGQHRGRVRKRHRRDSIQQDRDGNMVIRKRDQD